MILIMTVVLVIAITIIIVVSFIDYTFLVCKRVINSQMFVFHVFV